MEAFTITDGRITSDTCQQGCCPRNRPLKVDLHLAAEHIARGASAAPDRATRIAQVRAAAPLPEATFAAATPATPAHWLHAARTWDPATPPSPQTMAALILGAEDIATRDAVIASTLTQTVPTGLLIAVGRVARDQDVAILVILAMTSWLSGDVLAATAMLSRVTRTPRGRQDNLAQLLSAAIANGVNPAPMSHPMAEREDHHGLPHLAGAKAPAPRAH